QVAIVVDVVCPHDIPMIQRCNGPCLAVEAFENDVVSDLLVWQHFQRDSATHENVFAQIDAAHAAGAEVFQQLELSADDEIAPLTLENQTGLQMRENSVADHCLREELWCGRWLALRRQLLQIAVQRPSLEHVALGDEVYEFDDRCWGGHDLTQ